MSEGQKGQNVLVVFMANFIGVFQDFKGGNNVKLIR